MFYGTPSYDSGNNLYGNVSIPNNQPEGDYDLEVWDYGSNQWIMKEDAFEVIQIAGPNNPIVNSISPDNGDQGQTLSVIISGTNMNYGNQWSGTLSDFRFSQWSGSNMFYGNPTSTSGNYLYGDVSIPSGQNTGNYDLEVYDQSSGNWIMLNNAFEVIHTQTLSTAASVEILTNPMVVEGNTVLTFTTAGTVTDGVVITISYLNIKKEVTV